MTMLTKTKTCKVCKGKFLPYVDKCPLCGSEITIARNAFILFFLLLWLVINGLHVIDAFDLLLEYIWELTPEPIWLVIFWLLGSVVDVCGNVMLLMWNKNGFYMFFVMSILRIIVDMVNTRYSDCVTDLSPLIGIILIYCILKIKRYGISYWDAMDIRKPNSSKMWKILIMIIVLIGCIDVFFVLDDIIEIKKFQQERARLDRVSNKVKYEVNGVEFYMVEVKGSTFKMGATSEHGGEAYGDEIPVHLVALSDYYIGEKEVTVGLWDAVMGTDLYGYIDESVHNVSWDDCQEFIKKLNAITGKEFRLPTEAEWEYAARGGNKSNGYKYSGSNSICDVAWYTDNINWKKYYEKIMLPNELGIYDMSGNLWEWCQDWYGDYSRSFQTNPEGPSSGSYRVLRGGGRYSDAKHCRVSYRSYYFPDRSYGSHGFRLSL